MKNQFVTHEIAIKLKEIGFDEECLTFYVKENDEYKLAIHSQFDSYNFNTSKNSIKIKSSKNGYLDSVCAPLWQQVIDWFIDNHSLYIESPMYIIESGEYDGCYAFKSIIKSDENYKEKIIFEQSQISKKLKANEIGILKAIEIIKH